MSESGETSTETAFPRAGGSLDNETIVPGLIFRLDGRDWIVIRNAVPPKQWNRDETRPKVYIAPYGPDGICGAMTTREVREICDRGWAR